MKAILPENLKQRLINDATIIMSNEKHQIINESDDIREAIITFDMNEFWIWFNGKFIYSSKTFPSFEKRLQILADKWHLEETFESEFV